MLLCRSREKHVVLREMLSFGLEEFIVAIILHSLHDLSFIAFVHLIVSTLFLHSHINLT